MVRFIYTAIALCIVRLILLSSVCCVSVYFVSVLLLGSPIEQHEVTRIVRTSRVRMLCVSNFRVRAARISFSYGAEDLYAGQDFF